MNNSILISSDDEKFIKRSKEVGSYLKCNLVDSIHNIDFIDMDNTPDYAICIIDTRKLASNELAGACQVVSCVLPNAKSILIVDEKISVDQMRFIYTSGAKLILTLDEYFNQTKLEFFLTYIFNFEWIPVKSFDFLPNTEPNFMVYHLLSYKNKFIPMIHGSISPSKFKSMEEINELYIKREDLPKFCDYVKSLNITSQAGVASKCRALYSLFFDNYITLVLTLTDKTKTYTYEEGNKLLEEIKQSASNLLTSISSVEDPWLIIDNLSQKLSNTLFRTPAVALYCGISALNLEEEPLDIMVACLISNIGLLQLSPNYLAGKENDNDKHIYINHPLVSINTVLERKLPLNEKIKKIILNSHENPSGTGFPKGRNAPNPPKASQLIQICELLDSHLQIVPGKERFMLQEQKNKVLELKDMSSFSPDLVLKIKKTWTS